MPDLEKDTSTELKDLEAKLDTLIENYDSIKNENYNLKSKQDELVKEKAKLMEKTTIARTRVEAMISRLKSMEHGSWMTRLNYNLFPLRFLAKNIE